MALCQSPGCVHFLSGVSFRFLSFIHTPLCEVMHRFSAFLIQHGFHLQEISIKISSYEPCSLFLSLSLRVFLIFWHVPKGNRPFHTAEWMNELARPQLYTGQRPLLWAWNLIRYQRLVFILKLCSFQQAASPHREGRRDANQRRLHRGSKSSAPSAAAAATTTTTVEALLLL